MLAFIIGLAFGAVCGVAVIAVIIGAKANENPCETCKYKKIGVDILTGELQFPCNRCCNQYPDNYTEVEQ